MSTKGKKVKIIYFISIIMSLFVMNLNARESGYSISAAFVGMSMDYREYDDNGNILDSEISVDGELIKGGEISLAYTKVLEDNDYALIALNINYLYGETEYKGSLLNSGLGYGSYVGRTNNDVLDIEAEYRFVDTYSNGIDLTYGLGIGYRSWRRELSASQVEVYKWYSLRPKFGVGYQVSSLHFGGLLEYQYGLSPQMDILANAENPDTTVDLGSGNIIEFTLPVSYTINEQLDIFFEYVYQYQTIDKSNAVEYILDGVTEYIYEPDSTANNQYIKLGATFKF